MRAILSCAFLLGVACSGYAATLTVTNTNDSGPGSLRDALAKANSGDTINFNMAYPATITLTSGSLSINTNLTITGPGAANLAIDGNASLRILIVYDGTQVAISGITFQNALSPYCEYGGAIANGGTLNISQSVFSNNVVGYSNCTAPGGGAIVNGGSGVLNIASTLFSNNSAYRWGGAINNNGGVANVVNSTFVGNTGLDGAAFFNNGTLTVSDSTFFQNSAECGGGGGGVIENAAGTATFLNSTMVSNSSCLGGAFASYGGSIQIEFSTLSGNSANYAGANLYGGPFVIKNTIIANGQLTGNCYIGATTSEGFNLSDDDSCSGILNAIGDLNDTPSGLDPNGLQNNGSPTETISLVTGSPAINAIPAAYCTDFSWNPVTTDQRGISRPQGPACDIGALELVPVYTAPSSGSNCNGTYNGTFTGNLTVAAGQSCKFISGGITGNVTLNGGTLSLANADVGGNVQITGAAAFSLNPGTTIHGNLQIHNIPTAATQNQICGVGVHNDLQIQNNGVAIMIGDPSACPGNTVGGNLTVGSNTAPVQVSGNSVTGNLQCQSNTSITGSGNTAKSKQGQCASF